MLYPLIILSTVRSTIYKASKILGKVKKHEYHLLRLSQTCHSFNFSDAHVKIEITTSEQSVHLYIQIYLQDTSFFFFSFLVLAVYLLLQANICTPHLYTSRSLTNDSSGIKNVIVSIQRTSNKSQRSINLVTV